MKSAKQKRIRHKGYFPLYQADRLENRRTSHAWTDIVESKRCIFISTEIFTFLFTFPQTFELLLNKKGLEMIRSKRITSARISICFERSTVGDKLLIKFGANCVLIYNSEVKLQNWRRLLRYNGQVCK